MAQRKVIIDHGVVVSALRKCMLVGDTEKAEKMFRAAFETMDPEGRP